MKGRTLMSFMPSHGIPWERPGSAETPVLRSACVRWHNTVSVPSQQRDQLRARKPSDGQSVCRVWPSVCLGIFAVMCIDLYWFVLICIDLYWFVLICIDLYWFVLICIDLYWFVLICQLTRWRRRVWYVWFCLILYVKVRPGWWKDIDPGEHLLQGVSHAHADHGQDVLLGRFVINYVCFQCMFLQFFSIMKQEHFMNSLMIRVMIQSDLCQTWSKSKHDVACLNDKVCQDVRTEYCWLKNANDRLIAADVQTRAHMIVRTMQQQKK